MRLPAFLDRFIWKRLGKFELDDPRPIHAGAPYTYFLPQPGEVAAVRPGDLVKANFRPIPQNRAWDAERMWVIVDEASDAGFFGRLDNEPLDMPQLPCGTALFIPRTHVIDIMWAPDHDPPPRAEYRQYWDRCMVDQCVLNGASHVDYLYREEPEMTGPEDTYPDSEWRIRGTDEGISADETQGRRPHYLAVGAVLNRDDRWLHLLDEPIGAAFRWNPDLDDYDRIDEDQ